MTTLTVTADHTLVNEDVFLIFTNTNPYTRAASVPVIHNEARTLEDGGTLDSEFRPSAETPAIIDARMWNNTVRPKTSMARSAAGIGVTFDYVKPEETDEASDATPHLFSGIYGQDPGDGSIQATCRRIVESGDRRLSVYVADAAWHDGGTDEKLITDGMVSALAEEFFDPAAPDDDIWDWCVDIFGEPWGEVLNDAGSLIEQEAENHITILLYDIAADGSPGPGEGRYVGYYDSFDNYVEGATDSTGNYVSDGRLMFAIDSTLFATENGNTWESSDPWPQSVLSTLVHEFQHMIHYYQKEIRNNSPASSEVWLNEMCSMVAEDLLARRLQVNGPRGVPYDEPSAGSTATTNSTRLSEYNDWLENSLTDWEYTDPEVYRHYASSYSFGAYIARNYGGAELFAAIVRSPETGYQAVIDAIHEVNPGEPGLPEKLEDLLAEWGVATFTSDIEPLETGYLDGATYNRGAVWAESDGTLLTYDLGSINLENYANSNTYVNYGPVPFVYAGNGWDPAYMTKPAPASNTFVQVANGTSGDRSWTVDVPEDISVTIVARPNLTNH